MNDAVTGNRIPDLALSACPEQKYFVVFMSLCIGMLLRGVVEFSLLLKNGPLTPNIGKTVGVDFLEGELKPQKNGEHWTSRFCFSPTPSPARNKELVREDFTRQFRSSPKHNVYSWIADALDSHE